MRMFHVFVLIDAGDVLYGESGDDSLYGGAHGMLSLFVCHHVRVRVRVM